MKYVAFICKCNPMSCAGNNYIMFLNAKNISLQLRDYNYGMKVE